LALAFMLVFAAGASTVDGSRNILTALQHHSTLASCAIRVLAVRMPAPTRVVRFS
jgi:hypothetical protein